ncbi:SMI1-KNR4 cell-wall [Caloramator quimbayensis]|uniref:SMI1-KNR4 cell-wall n=1 Tax=Caloramator quimbayensis TaxID=1147123 RepID=A0A1T4X897_9CLOT|nr:SMI1/KNR4 family protein [Caloramator quimbayensis]SKA85328.1 SMI1-KNR4 cell-wall [Caloramator quimbayensis]
MNKVRFEKFEMKYGSYLPEDFKRFLIKYGGDAQFGSCRFEYAENIINNILRVPGEMDFHLIPFGDIGNGDYYCFYKYGPFADDYYVGIWLHETRNFVILASSFKSFIYKCLLDDYLSTLIPNESLSESENAVSCEESLERCKILSEEYNFDFKKVKNMKNEFDYHRFMLEYDEKALQSLCFVGKSLMNKKDLKGFNMLENAIKHCYFYTAPYYLLGKMFYNTGKDGNMYFKQALKTSLGITGYSYWEEDYLEIPLDVHREIALYVDNALGKSKDFIHIKIYNGEDPYDYKFRLSIAREYIKNNDYDNAMIEYNNALFCCEDKSALKDILKEACNAAKEGGLLYLAGIIENDVRKIR